MPRRLQRLVRGMGKKMGLASALITILCIFHVTRGTSRAIDSLIAIDKPVTTKAGLVRYFADRATILDDSVKHEAFLLCPEPVKLLFANHYAVHMQSGKDGINKCDAKQGRVYPPRLLIGTPLFILSFLLIGYGTKGFNDRLFKCGWRSGSALVLGGVFFYYGGALIFIQHLPFWLFGALACPF